LPASLLQVRNESLFEACATALLDQFLGGGDRKHPALMHQRDAIAALSLIHKVGREKDRYAIISGEIDQRAPERVARNGVDARRGLVENEHGRPVQDRDRQLQSLLDAERQALRLGVDCIL
jgi:hypothetical protein